MERYPVEMAVPTTFAASSFGTCQTPKPNWGIALPSLKPMVGWVDIYQLILFLFYYFLFEQHHWPCGAYRIIIISYVLSRNLMFSSEAGESLAEWDYVDVRKIPLCAH